MIQKVKSLLQEVFAFNLMGRENHVSLFTDLMILEKLEMMMNLMTILKWVFAIAVGGFLLLFGYLKFSGAAFIFPYIEFKGGEAGLPLAELAYPLGNYLVGGMELLAGLLVILPQTRGIGAPFAVLPFAGAVFMHLTPYLGTVTPLDFATPKPVDALAAGEGFVRTDFTVESGSSLFIIAVAMLIVAIINVFIQRKHA